MLQITRLWPGYWSVRFVAKSKRWVSFGAGANLQIQSSLAPHLLGKVDGMLRGIVKSLYDANSEVIISLYTWRAHSELLREICRSDEESDEEAGQVWQSVQERNERLGFKVAASDSTTSPRRNQMEEISVSPSLVLPMAH